MALDSQQKDIVVRQENGFWHLHWAGRSLPCAIGRGGATAEKREGDGTTPLGRWALREVFYRPDRLPKPSTSLPVAALTPADGWCDDPSAPEYNQRVMLPYAGHHETLWRDDEIYDVIVVLGYNDDPPVAGLGSAIFLHIARPDYAVTEGCVALERSALLDLLQQVSPETNLCITES